MKFTFLGRRMSQTAKAISLWEQILAPLNFKRIIEIGTQSGNFSLYLYLFCLSREAEFYTYDIERQHDICPVKDVLNFDRHFMGVDVFNYVSLIGRLIDREGISVVFCDGGNKEREFLTFSPFLKPGDVIAVHDWGTEVHRDNLKLDGFTELLPAASDDEGFTRFFRKE